MKSDILWLDYETKSKCDLPKHGAYNYSLDASTKVLCLGFAFNDEPAELWWPGAPIPERIKLHFRDGLRIYAHNAGFDRLITENVLCNDYDVPRPPLSAWYCTATQSSANCAPRKLEDVGRFANTKIRKNHRGAFLIRALSLPKPDGSFNDDPVLMHEMGVYCLDDINTMREFSNAMRPLSDLELRDYHINEKINDRGMLVDVALADAAQKYSVAELEEVQARVLEITSGEITSVRSSKMKAWVVARLGPEALKLMEVWEEGEMRYSLDKNIRANLMLMDDPDQIPPDVLEVIQCADDIWASSVAKYKRLYDLADEEDQRVRGAFVFAGGAATGRASSYGAQVHNFTRKVAKNSQAVRDVMVAGGDIVPQFGKRVTDVLKSMMRPTILAKPGSTLVVSDWSKIEAVLNPWLANTPKADALLDVFRSGKDLYCREAAGIYRVPEAEILAGVEAGIEKYITMRQIGKVAVLACGFGGGVGAFAAMGKAYGVVMEESEARQIVSAWRRANPWAPEYWAALEEAYTCAMRHTGREFSAGRVTYMFDGQHLWYALPSGRVLCYPYARLEADGITYAKSAWKPKADATEWPRARLWHGLACENCWSGNTRLVTESGIKCIQDILDSDLIWDGYEFVPHGGVVCNGVQEVLQWSDVYVTKHHQIFDGKVWSAVIALTESTIERSLKWGLSLATWKSCRTMDCLTIKGAPKLSVLVAASLQLLLGSLKEVVSNARRVWPMKWPRKPSRESMAVSGFPYQINCVSLGYIAAQELYRGVVTPYVKPTQITAPEASIYIKRGLTTLKFGWPTSLPLKNGMCQVWIWTASITKKVIFPVICGLFRAPITRTTDVIPSRLPLKVGRYLFAIFGKSIAQIGKAITRSRTTLLKEKPEMKLPRITNERKEVFDVKNCGPRHQYMVVTDLGFLIAHNCTQATANDLLREALFKCDEDDIDVILHVHDEIVSEVPIEQAQEFLAYQEAIMLEPPAWGLDIPLGVESKVLARYGK